jgi:hypothetical protein
MAKDGFEPRMSFSHGRTKSWWIVGVDASTGPTKMSRCSSSSFVRVNVRLGLKSSGMTRSEIGSSANGSPMHSRPSAYFIDFNDLSFCCGTLTRRWHTPLAQADIR